MASAWFNPSNQPSALTAAIEQADKGHGNLTKARKADKQEAFARHTAQMLIL